MSTVTGGRPVGPARGVAAGLVAMAVLAGCGTPRAPVTPGVVKVVAGENFWGNIAGQIGGGRVQVTSILSNPQVRPRTVAVSA
jgi:zinc/manganese transport system substrate-binding protein